MAKGLQRALALLVSEYRAARLHRKGVRTAHKYRGLKDLKLNLGCGEMYKDGWVNIDLFNTVADLRIDLREKLPFSDETCSDIYSEHTFEHFSHQDGCFLLNECYRVLEKGGTIRIGVPDTQWPLENYTLDTGYFKAAQELWHPQSRTRLEHINEHFRQDSEHLYAYDFETLELTLRDSGFVNIKRADYDSLLDSSHRSLGTLYVTAEKP